MINNKKSLANPQELEKIFYELLDQWHLYNDVVRELNRNVASAFSAVAQGNSPNPSFKILELLDSAENKREEIQEKMNAVTNAIKNSP